MNPTKWTNTDIHSLFHLDNKIKSRQTLLNAEERGEIPKAERVSRGKVQVRLWDISQLPEIGKKYGFLKKPTKQSVFCVYTPKGGVLKTTFAFNLARMLSINGIKVAIIGLDIQCSITKYALPKLQIDSIDELKADRYLGLYHFFFEEAPLEDIIQSTNLPTLDVIPEVAELNMLEKKLRFESRREYFFRDKLLPKLKYYDVIIFDNGPSWNQLVECALTASNVILSPIGCDIETYEALKTNLGFIEDFKKTMNLEWDSFYLIPTLLEKTKLSQQIYASYLNNFQDCVISIPIRRSISGQEARIFQVSAMEFDAKSLLAQDYYEAVQEIWSKVETS